MNLQLFATSGGQMAESYNTGVAGVTQEDYCAAQVQLGVRPDVCAARYQRYNRKVQGKGQKMVSGWQNK